MAAWTSVTLNPKPFLVAPPASSSPGQKALSLGNTNSLSRLSFPAFFQHIKGQTLCFKRNNGFRVNAIATKWDPSKVVPQADRVLVRLEDLSETSAGGLLLPKSAVKFERYLVGQVLSVGSEVEGVDPGKKVLLSDVSAYEVDLGTDARHCFCKAGDLLAVVE